MTDANSTLTQEYLKEILHYNPETGVFTRLVRTCNGANVGDIAGTVNKTKQGKRYNRITINYNVYRVHRLAFLYMNGRFPLEQVDHIDGNGLNNKWENLAEASASDNQRNKRLQSNNSTGCTGVHFCNKSEKYVASIKNDNKRITLGYFCALFDAAAARKSAENKFGYHKNHGSVRPL